MTTQQDLKARLDFAVGAAREAGEHTLRYYQSDDLVIDRKVDRSPVTRADREAEELVRERLAVAFPDDAVLGEEFGEKTGTTGYRWYLDPVDGTESFIRGVPLFGTMLGLELGDAAVAGVIAFPALREIVFGAKGLGAWWANRLPPVAESGPAVPDPHPARVSIVSDLAEATFSTTSVTGYHEVGREAMYERLRAAARVDRGWSDCYGHYLVATGRIDVMVDAQMHVWDCAPLQPIIEEAGGRFTDLAGNATIHGDSAISTNGLLHEAALAAVRG